MQEKSTPSWMTSNMVIACSCLQQCLVEYLASIRRQTNIEVANLAYVQELSALAIVESNLEIGMYVFAVDAQETLVLLHAPTHQAIENPMCIFCSGEIDEGVIRANTHFYLIRDVSELVQAAFRSHRRLNVCARCLHVDYTKDIHGDCRGRCDAYVPFVNLIGRKCKDLHGLSLMCRQTAATLARIQTCRGEGVTELRMIAKQCFEIADKLNDPRKSKKLKKLYIDLFDRGCSHKLPQEYPEFAQYFT